MEPATAQAGNTALQRAKKAKQDEFYTQYADIQNEINAYLDYNSDTFRGKTVLLPCDDPETSQFTMFFAQNFSRLGLKRLVSTSYAPTAKQAKYGIKPSARDKKFELDRGRKLVIEHDVNGDGEINFNDLEWTYLEGDGDFRSDEVKKLRDEADIIVTNPPFSLFREFVAWIFEADKKFLIIGNMNSVTYKEVFPLIKGNRLWLGNGFAAGNAYFKTLCNKGESYSRGVFNAKTGLVKFRNTCWLTNLEHGRRHKPLELMTMADNIRFSKHKNIRGQEYRKYDNYDAIEVPYTDAIPSDYDGVMGVPISFLDKYCPEQFEILGVFNHGCDHEFDLAKPTINGEEIFKRIAIRRKKEEVK